jgi:hypothetical protein
MKKVYKGFREASGRVCVRVCEDGIATPLAPRLDLWNHSPDGLEWGYHGSGPAQLAMALLADATRSDAIALCYHQELKREIIACMNRDESWEMSEHFLLRWTIVQLAELCEAPIPYRLPRPGEGVRDDG